MGGGFAVGPAWHTPSAVVTTTTLAARQAGFSNLGGPV